MLWIKLRLGFSVDEEYYRARYPDTSLTGMTAKEHFRRTGWREGRSPNPHFDPIAYLVGVEATATGSGDAHADRPWIHSAARLRGLPVALKAFARSYASVADSGYFDKHYYLAANPTIVGDPIEHFVRIGGGQGLDPGPRFSARDYLARYPDVRGANFNPLLHFIQHGRAEGRLAVSSSNAKGATDAPDTMSPTDVLAEPYCPPLDLNRQEASEEIGRRLGGRAVAVVDLVGPLISILTPVYNVPEKWLRQMVASVLNQTYRNWELCLVDDASTDPNVSAVLLELAASDRRIFVKIRSENGGISAATNDSLAMAHGEYIALLDNDDMLTDDALEQMVASIEESDYPDWLYSDEFKIDEENRVSDLFAKPDWSPFMLLNYMYTGHLTLYRRDLVEKVGGFRTEYDFSQDYDLALRISEVPGIRVVHVEKYLYAWRMIATSSSMGGKPTARISNIAALQDAVDRRGWNGVAEPLPTANRVIRTMESSPTVSIVIPSDNAANISAAITSILEKTDYTNYEIIVVTNSGLIARLENKFEAAPIVWKAYDKVFNFSDKCNEGAFAGRGEYVVFFNDDVRVITRDWVEAILEYATLPGVGVVGPKLLYENGLIQHAGMGTGMRRLVGTVFHAYPDATRVHFNFAQCVRDVSLICGALLAMPMTLFKEVGGYDAVNAPIGHSDVDLCLRVREAGYSCVYTPYAKLYHIGHASIGEEKATRKAFKIDKSDVFLLRRFSDFIARDPFFTPAMQALTYIDSPEPFRVFPGEDGVASNDLLILSHDMTASGAPKVAFDLAVLFKSKGWFVTVASPVDGVYRKRLEAEGITVVIDELILTGHDSSMVLARSFDMVIANTIVCWPAVGVLSSTTPTYLYAHETELVHHFANIFPGFVESVKRATEVWCGSELSAKAMATIGVPSQILEYGVDDAREAAIARPITIALFGSFEARKAQDLAIMGMGRVREDVRDQARLRLYGRTLDHGFRAAIEELAKPIPEVVFHNELKYGEYREALANADIVIICSRDDTLPLVSLDALAMGKAVICSATTGTSQYLEHEESALILYDNSVDEIERAYTRLIQNPVLRAKLGRGARDVFEKHFTYAAFDRRVSARLTDIGGRAPALATDLARS